MTASTRVKLEDLGLSGSCLEFVRHLWDYLDEELTPAGSERLKQHLAECEQCRAYGEYQSCFFDTVARLRASLDAPAELREKLAEKLKGEGCGCWERAKKQD